LCAWNGGSSPCLLRAVSSQGIAVSLHRMTMEAHNHTNGSTSRTHSWSRTLPVFVLSSAVLSAIPGLDVLDRFGTIEFVAVTALVASVWAAAYLAFLAWAWRTTSNYRAAKANQLRAAEALVAEALSDIRSPDYLADLENTRWRAARAAIEAALKTDPDCQHALNLLAFTTMPAVKSWENRRSEKQLSTSEYFSQLSELYVSIPGVRWTDQGERAIPDTPPLRSIRGLAHWLFTTPGSKNWNQWVVTISVVIGIALVLLLGSGFQDDRFGDSPISRAYSSLCSRLVPSCNDDVDGFDTRDAVYALETHLATTYPHDEDRVLNSISCYDLNVSHDVQVRQVLLDSTTVGEAAEGFEVRYTFEEAYDVGHEDYYTETVLISKWQAFPPVSGRGWIFEPTFENYPPTWWDDDTGISLTGLTCG
jgi:hypothetical protein